MKLKFVLFLCCALLTLPLLAQDETPRVDIFGAYSHANNFNVGMSGWLASGNLNLNRWLGVEGDINGEYGTQDIGAIGVLLPGVPTKIHSRMHSFNFGPSATYRSEQYDAFGHLLFGVSHTNLNAAGTSQGDSSFSWVLGGGGDYNFTPTWAGRFQLDLLRTNFFNRGANHARIAVGIVYRLGSQ